MRYLQHSYVKYGERQILNDEAPDVEKAANGVWTARIDAFTDAMAKADDELSWPAHWLYSDHNDDDCEDYCLPCAQKAVARLNAEHVAKRNGRIGPPTADEMDSDEDEPWSVDGGDGSEDGPAVCTVCGAMLDYHLSESTLEDELHHFLDGRVPGPVSEATEALEISRLLKGLRDLGPSENDIIQRSLRLIDLVDLNAVNAEIAARKAGTWIEDVPPSDPVDALEMAA